MNKNTTVEIRPVGNGWCVMPGDDWRGDRVGSSSEYLVFQSMVELQCWLQEHFEYRSGAIASDKEFK